MPLTKDLLPMEARLVAELPRGREWLYEPKWDGFRCLAFRRGNEVELRSKSGKPLGRYFPEIAAMLKRLSAPHFVLDGELLIGRGDHYSFSDLQLRLHPAASRVEKLSREQPASFVVFDLLEEAKKELTALPFEERRARLEAFHKKNCVGERQIILSPQSPRASTAMGWLKNKKWHVDGLVAKNRHDKYQPGERAMRKYKLIRTADCVVGGFRYASNSHQIGSLLLGLYDDEGALHHVGFTSSIPSKDRQELTDMLEKIVQKPGFTGRAPGAPSRWSTERSAEWEPLAPKIVAEVAYDHVTDERFRHGTRLLGFRPDKPPAQCTMDQILH